MDDTRAYALFKQLYPEFAHYVALKPDLLTDLPELCWTQEAREGLSFSEKQYVGGLVKGARALVKDSPPEDADVNGNEG